MLGRIVSAVMTVTLTFALTVLWTGPAKAQGQARIQEAKQGPMQGFQTVGVRQVSVTGTMAPMRADAPSKASTARPDSLYVLHCAGCHGMDGRGHAQAQVPDLHDMPLLLDKAGGREFLIRVPGVMGSGLSDAEVALVMNWIVTRYLPRERAATVPAFSADEIHQARQNPLSDVMKTRRTLLGVNASGEVSAYESMSAR